MSSEDNADDAGDGGFMESLRWGPLPVNRSWNGPDDLRKYLLDSASHHAYMALRGFTSNNNEMAIAGMHAGIAIEHLAKCYLASVHPALLADKACDIDTLLHLVGKSKLARTSPYAIKTIGAVEACKRVRHLLPEFRFNEQADASLFTVRNSVSHLGIVDDVRKAMRIMVRIADAILEGLGYDRTRFWGNRINVVETLRDETMGETQAILDIKYEAARLNLLGKLAGFDDVEQAAFKAVIANVSHSTSDYEERYECPVCRSRGWLICSREYDMVENSLTPGDFNIVFNEPYAYPFAYECNVCELQLDGDELKATGMPNEIALPQSEIGKKM